LSLFFDVTAPLSVAASPGATVGYGWFTLKLRIRIRTRSGWRPALCRLWGGVEGPAGYIPTTQDLLGSTVFSVNVTAPVTTP